MLRRNVLITIQTRIGIDAVNQIQPTDRQAIDHQPFATHFRFRMDFRMYSLCGITLTNLSAYRN